MRCGSSAIGAADATGARAGASAGILLEDRALHVAQRRSGLDAELLDERPARGLEGLERLRLTSTPIQRHHLLRPKALVQRILRDQHLELSDQLHVAPARELRVDRALQRNQAQLVQTRRDRSHTRLVGEISERRPAPQRQRSAELHRRDAEAPVGQRPRTGARAALEHAQIERALLDRGDVATPPGDDRRRGPEPCATARRTSAARCPR